MISGFTRIFCKPALVVIFVLLFCFSTFAQNSDDDVIRIRTDLISFEATVTDAQGKPVRDLKSRDFKIYEDGVERPIAFFEQQRRENFERPMSVVFALDVSGSMTFEELQKLRSALSVFTGRLATADSYFAVMAFGMEVKTLQSFTNNTKKLEKSFDKILRETDGLSTHAYDAVDDAVRMLNKKAPRTARQIPMRKVVILVTDGFPVGDTVEPETVVERANTSEVSIFNVILPSYSRRQIGSKPLPTPLDVSGLSEKTGGSSFYLTGDNFDAMFGRLAEEITSTYLLAFYPDDAKRADGSFRQVKIETLKGLRLKQNRAGYNAPKEKGN
jgi:VWFA-related protein